MKENKEILKGNKTLKDLISLAKAGLVNWYTKVTLTDKYSGKGTTELSNYFDHYYRQCIRGTGLSRIEWYKWKEDEWELRVVRPLGEGGLAECVTVSSDTDTDAEDSKRRVFEKYIVLIESIMSMEISLDVFPDACIEGANSE